MACYWKQEAYPSPITFEVVKWQLNWFIWDASSSLTALVTRTIVELNGWDTFGPIPHLGPWLIWAPTHLGPNSFGPRLIWAPTHLGPNTFGPQLIWAPTHLGPNSFGLRLISEPQEIFQIFQIFQIWFQNLGDRGKIDRKNCFCEVIYRLMEWK